MADNDDTTSTCSHRKKDLQHDDDDLFIRKMTAIFEAVKELAAKGPARLGGGAADGAAVAVEERRWSALAGGCARVEVRPVAVLGWASLLCESRDSGSLVDIEPVSRRDTDNVDKVQENVQNGDPVPDYQGDTVDADGHVDDVVHQEQEVPSQVPVDLPRRSDRERRPSTRYSSSQDILECKMLELEKIHTDENGSDMMTKALPRGKFEACCSIAGMAISST
nr:Retrovirus-related Pol polyprotein from transposon TNT 1-94 [Ipomoea batatas]